MHFTWFSRRDGVFSHEFTISCPEPRLRRGQDLVTISHGFPGEMEFSPTSSPYPAQSRGSGEVPRRGQDLVTSGRKPISPGTPCEMHFLPMPVGSYIIVVF